MDDHKYYRVVGNIAAGVEGPMHNFPIGIVVSGNSYSNFVAARDNHGLLQTLRPEHVCEVKRYRVTDHRFPADTYVYDKGDEGYTDEEGQIQDLWHDGVEAVQ